MRAGPKGAVTADPLDFSSWPAGRAKLRERFIGEFLINSAWCRGRKKNALFEFLAAVVSTPERLR